jgi:hypothetical protein
MQMYLRLLSNGNGIPSMDNITPDRPARAACQVTQRAVA